MILEPTVPLSFGPVRWMGLPAKAVYDIQLLPSPNRRDYFEWTHNDPCCVLLQSPGRKARWASAASTSTSRSRRSRTCAHGSRTARSTSTTLESSWRTSCLPVSVPVLPIPSHGTFGFRRKITDSQRHQAGLLVRPTRRCRSRSTVPASRAATAARR